MNLKKKLKSGEFVVLAEMETPRGVDISELVGNAQRLKGRVDAVVVPDMDCGAMRLSALAGAALMQQQGIESVIHVYGRDRNQMALQSDLLGAYVLGVRNLVVVSGEGISQCDHRKAKAVDDLDEMSILQMIRCLQQGLDLAGFELKGTPAFTTGCTLPACADEKAFEAAIEQVRRKIAAGAEYVVTAPIFNFEHSISCLKRAMSLGVPVIPTVLLLKSVGMARYIAVNEPGSMLSEALIARIRKAPDREEECLRIAAEIVAGLKGVAQGIKIQALGWEHRLPAVLDLAGI
ncbi:MAG: methylenetetrahydrofolate reductase [Deltaproteobacteria bacterium]|nr:methylenetetrahydrofolate reductase [Deltaproteobacteria bacterium]